jgi:UDP-N-acetylglucosamine--N-acetylmuramyl-(pentapeptide) pyrophosphoryl-undecaprenol N-acetylglucosamine transferase
MLDEARAACAEAGVKASIEPFITDMAAAYGWADLVIGRAGALTIAELCAAGVGSLLVPFPGAVDDHQAANADYLKEHGGGDWLRQDANLESGLRERLQAVLSDRATARRGHRRALRVYPAPPIASLKSHSRRPAHDASR